MRTALPISALRRPLHLSHPTYMTCPIPGRHSTHTHTHGWSCGEIGACDGLHRTPSLLLRVMFRSARQAWDCTSSAPSWNRIAATTCSMAPASTEEAMFLRSGDAPSHNMLCTDERPRTRNTSSCADDASCQARILLRKGRVMLCEGGGRPTPEGSAFPPRSRQRWTEGPEPASSPAPKLVPEPVPESRALGTPIFGWIFRQPRIPPPAPLDRPQTASLRSRPTRLDTKRQKATRTRKEKPGKRATSSMRARGEGHKGTRE